MATINNQSLLKDLINKVKFQLSVDKVPTQLAEKIVPVVIAEPEKNIRVVSGSLADATSFTLLITSTTKRTFVTSVIITYACSVLSDSKAVTVGAFVKGMASQNLIVLRKEPLTALQESAGTNYLLPIELEKGSIVTIGSDTATASIDVSVSMTYYELED